MNEFKLEYFNKGGHSIISEYYDSYDEAKEMFDNLVNTYETMGIENCFALELSNAETEEILDVWEAKVK